MSYKKLFYSGLVLLLLCGGCGLTEGVVQKEQQSFLRFTGDTTNTIVYIDDLAPLILNELNSSAAEESGKSAKSRKIHYKIAPGRHTIVVKKAGNEVVNRNILLGDGITKEIEIP